MKKVIIFGKTVVAELAHFYFVRDAACRVVAFTVNQEFIDGDDFLELPLVAFEDIEKTFSPSEYELFIAVGPSRMNSFRELKFNEAKEKGYHLFSYISSNSICCSDLGENCFVADGVVVNPFCKIGNNNFIWEQSLVCNNCEILDHCYLSPKSVVSSYSLIKNNSIVGTSSVVKARVVVEEKTLIGASCYISKSTQVQSVYGRKCSDHLGNISEKVDISM
jgi:acetyltransferase-like isoleucine patch superfamily enzyme